MPRTLIATKVSKAIPLANSKVGLNQAESLLARLLSSILVSVGTLSTSPAITLCSGDLSASVNRSKTVASASVLAPSVSCSGASKASVNRSKTAISWDPDKLVGPCCSLADTFRKLSSVRTSEFVNNCQSVAECSLHAKTSLMRSACLANSTACSIGDVRGISRTSILCCSRSSRQSAPYFFSGHLAVPGFRYANRLTNTLLSSLKPTASACAKRAIVPSSFTNSPIASEVESPRA